MTVGGYDRLRPGPLDLHLLSEGRHRRLWEVLGAHPVDHDGFVGSTFAVWAPHAIAVSVVGDFNSWESGADSLERIDGSDIWWGAVPGARPAQRYKFALTGADGVEQLHADPLARRAELPPATASVIEVSDYVWRDATWVAARTTHTSETRMSIYEVHLPSWRRGSSPATYRDLAPELANYVTDLGFTHVELMPIAEHPFGGSWGYQVTGYYAPTARLGSPDDFRYLVDELHRAGVGVILDWVPAHFPADAWALAAFDGEPLYEHGDPARSVHPDWGTLEFDLGRAQVRNFLVSNALYWIEEFHVDGLRVDAVASMLYLDYSRGPGEWRANQHGGNEDLDAVAFLREVNDEVNALHPHVMMIAEESTAWPGVSAPTSQGGLGFTHKWNMGWMHDTLRYFGRETVHRRHHQHDVTFGLSYAWSERFVLPLSHDEVVHGKGSLLTRMPGDEWQRFANLRALLAWMWCHPGKQLLFMGGELGQAAEWDHDRELDWSSLEHPLHAGVQRLVRDLNRVQAAFPALWAADHDPAGFRWIAGDDVTNSVVSFVRLAPDARPVVCVAAFTAAVVSGYRLGVPSAGVWTPVLATDATVYGGSGVVPGSTESEAIPWHGMDQSICFDLPPLSVVWFVGTTDPV